MNIKHLNLSINRNRLKNARFELKVRYREDLINNVSMFVTASSFDFVPDCLIRFPTRYYIKLAKADFRKQVKNLSLALNNCRIAYGNSTIEIYRFDEIYKFDPFDRKSK